MRIQVLRLLRYGCFEGTELSMPENSPDLHLICGLNEAGKSTVLNAIEDLLFGFKKTTPFAFRHLMKDLRVGATVTGGGEAFSFRRRKGNQNTLLDEDERAINEELLEVFLGPVDRELFQRMYSLDHERLRAGGSDILSEEGEVGRALFAAGAGLTGLSGELASLEQEADGLWGPRKAAGRRYHEAEERFKAATDRLRDATVLTRTWRDAAAEVEQAEAGYERVAGEHRAKEAERRKLERIRRLLPHLARHRSVGAEIAAMGSGPDLPADSNSVFTVARTAYISASSRIQTLAAQLKADRERADQIRLDQLLLDHAEEITTLRDRRSVIDKHGRDIPKREAEAAQLEEDLRRHMKDIGWSDVAAGKVEERLPARPLLDLLRELIERKGTIDAQLRSAGKNVAESEAKLKALKAKLESLEAPAPDAELNAAIKEAQQTGELSEQLVDEQTKLKRLRKKLKVASAKLRPWSGELSDLSILVVPETVVIEEFAEKARALSDEQKDIARQLRDVGAEIAGKELHRSQITREEEAVSSEELRGSRRSRDQGWKLILRKYVREETVTEAELSALGPDPVAGYERRVGTADEVADRRFERAEASAQLAELERSLERGKATQDRLQARQSELEESAVSLERDWNGVWKPCGFSPGAPAAMISWLQHRDDVLGILEDVSAQEDRIIRLEARQAGIEARLVSALTALGVEANDSGPATLAMAEGLAQRLAACETKRQSLQAQIVDAQILLDAHGKELKQSETDRAAWQEEWRKAVKRATLPEDSGVEAVRGNLTIFGDLRDLASRIRELRSSRIATMQRDIDEFAGQAGALVARLAADLAGLEPAAAITELSRRVEGEAGRRDRREQIINGIEENEEKLRSAEEERKAATALARPLMTAAGTEDWDELRREIERSDQRRELLKHQMDLKAIILKEGDGKSFEDLEAECGESDPDDVKGRLEALEAELSVLAGSREEAAELRTQAERNLSRIAGGAGAAQAEADRQQALTGMREAAERYVRLKGSAVLLRWAIDKFRQQRQAPLLQRASSVFQTLTVGRFERLSVGYDEKDQPHLVGIRPDQERVEVIGMSDGSLDQLYLALKIASLESHLGGDRPLPFIADDLFINFDDERAAAGLKAMADLANRTQVLFFTHHEHLLEIARDALPESSFAVVRL